MCSTSGLVIELMPARHLGVVAEFPRRQMLHLVLLRFPIRSQIHLVFFFVRVMRLLGLRKLSWFCTCFVLFCLLRLISCRSLPVPAASIASASAPIRPMADAGAATEQSGPVSTPAASDAGATPTTAPSSCFGEAT